jgi:hypothetical protein
MTDKDAALASSASYINAMFATAMVLTVGTISLQSDASPKQPEPKTTGPKVPVIAPPTPPKPNPGPVFKPRPEPDRPPRERSRDDSAGHRPSADQIKYPRRDADGSGDKSGTKEYRKVTTDYKQPSPDVPKDKVK